MSKANNGGAPVSTTKVLFLVFLGVVLCACQQDRNGLRVSERGVVVYRPHEDRLPADCLWMETDKAGYLETIGGYDKDGLRDGLWVYLDVDGQGVLSFGRYINGERTGLWFEKKDGKQVWLNWKTSDRLLNNATSLSEICREGDYVMDNKRGQ